MYTFQNVINLLKKVNSSIRAYVIGLLLTHGRKNCANMADSIGISAKQFYKYMSEATSCSDEIEKILLDYACKTRTTLVKRALVIDPTSIIKRYARSIENLCYDRDGCTKHVEQCLVPVCASVTDENVKIPLTLDFWIQEKIVGKNRYKSKVKIAQGLITSLKDKGAGYDFISLDGAFPTPDMFAFFKKTGEKFIMRIPKNRCITLKNKKRVQLKHCQELKLPRNSREKTVQAELYGDAYFFTAQKRRRKGEDGEWETIFLVSNMDLRPKQQVASYNLRWPQEKINRTNKQKFGMTECRALSAQKQKAHILAGFLAHSIIEVAKNDKQEQTVDEIVNSIRKFHFDDLVSIIDWSKVAGNCQNIDRGDCNFQNHVQNFCKSAVEMGGLAM